MNFITANNGCPMDAMHTNIANFDIATPTKLSMLPTCHALLLPDRMHSKRNHDRMDSTREKQTSKSFCSLDYLTREAHMISTCTFAASSSNLKLHQHSWKSVSRFSETNGTMKNAVFEIYGSRTRRRPRALVARNSAAHDLMRKELLLDDMGSLLRRMTEYRRQVKSKTFIPDFDSDSEEEDLE
ncbi:unnamed protein product [Cylindrotheca closterium]|uniref:Uncharacterized protein n=1 Tax=Cylindrotheca closterium TaxID=2856 RepID=A0AAD2G1K3_9STRA|nr:unnamed protein product [Cylindrotheca closterium]CAJ1959579.1 unnamed protein product [Cylindrotheca closterium]